MTDAVQQLLTEAADLFAQHDSDIGRSLSDTLRRVRAEPLTRVPGVAPTLAPGPRTGALDALTACQDALPWRRPGFGHLPVAVAGRIHVAEIVGPQGMLAHDRIRFGVLMQDARHAYPSHRHAAEELYVTLAGTAWWRADETAPSCHGPGAFIHHRPWQPHAMETGPEAMLALWGWTGQIDGGSYSLGG